MDMDADGIPETSVCCGTEGNNQPQRDGVWCAGIDHATGAKLWKEQVAHRGQTASGDRTYAMRIKMKAEKTIEGANTGKLVLQYQMHRGNNNNNKKGGYDDKVLMAYATPTRTGLAMAEPMDITNEVIKSQVEFTHANMFQTFTGTTDAPITTFSFLAPNHNGGGGVNSGIMNVPVAAGQVMGSAVHNLSGPMDGQKYSKYLGDNPNNQGRNYTDCHIVPNPFIGAIGAGGSTAGVPVVNICALTGKLTSAGVPAMKPDLFFEIWSSLETPNLEEPGEEPTPGEEPGEEPGTDNGTGNGDNGSGFSSSGGCSTTGSSSGGLGFLFLGLAMFAIRRRRSL
jgi:MYXO-CTERM domain-containing protein